MVLKEFVLSEVCQLKKEAKTLPTSKSVSMENRNSSDPANAEANELLLKKLEKKNNFLREDSHKKIKILIENITDLNKKIITQIFSYNQNNAEYSNKDVVTKSSTDI